MSEAVGLGYIGVDVVIDASSGPTLLEANVRPGLAIQIANGKGLLPRLEAIDAMLDRPRIGIDDDRPRGGSYAGRNSRPHRARPGPGGGRPYGDR